MTKRSRCCVALAIVALVSLAFGVGSWVYLYDGRKNIDLVSYVEHPGPYMPDARLATEELCGGQLPCIQAVDSDTLTMLRFETQGEASAAAASLGGDTRLAGWIVVTFKSDGLSAAERSEFASALYCQHVGEDPC